MLAEIERLLKRSAPHESLEPGSAFPDSPSRAMTHGEAQAISTETTTIYGFYMTVVHGAIDKNKG